MDDGNICEDGEEMNDNLCYKSCGSLTNGAFPFRTTAFSCCSSQPCYGVAFVDQNVSESFFVDKKGDIPHPPGACLLDEEYLLGRCYKKCSVLTNGTFPYRAAAASCCKTRSTLGGDTMEEWAASFLD